MKRTAVFGRKMANINELKSYTADYMFEQEKFTVIKEIELTEKGFNNFCNAFLRDNKLIEAERNEMWCDDESGRRCLFFYCKEQEQGVLVESEGYAYARYTALINKSDLAEDPKYTEFVQKIKDFKTIDEGKDLLSEIVLEFGFENDIAQELLTLLRDTFIGKGFEWGRWKKDGGNNE